MLILCVYVAATTAVSVIAGPIVVACVFLWLGAGWTIYSAAFGYLGKVLPGIRIIDYAVFLFVMSVITYFILAFETQVGIVLIAVLCVTLMAWGIFCLLRLHAWRAGSAVPIDEILGKKK